MALTDKQTELTDAVALARELVSALENAESCESVRDFRANIEDAYEHLRSIRKELTEIMPPITGGLLGASAQMLIDAADEDLT